MLVVALFLAGSLVASEPLGPIPTEGPPPAAELHALREDLLDALNAHRVQYGLAQLRIDSIAQEAAQYQAEDMLQTGRMGHFDSTGRSPIDRFEGFGGHADYYGENVGEYKPAVIEQHLLWNVIALLDREMMAETPPNDGHRQNILGSHYTAVGIGIAVGDNGVFISEDFVGYVPQERVDAPSSR